MAGDTTAVSATSTDALPGDKARTRPVLYTRAGCQFCAAAKALLAKRGIGFEEIDVTGDAEALERLAERSGLATLPQLFRDGEPLGGFEDIRRLDSSGELQAQIERSAPR